MILTATKREMEGKGKVVPTEITSKRHLHRCSDPTAAAAPIRPPLLRSDHRCSDPATTAPARKDNDAAEDTGLLFQSPLRLRGTSR
ncbi:hypothetical protein LINPERHAP2_LOCUS27337 [Linum perenne]